MAVKPTTSQETHEPVRVWLYIVFVALYLLLGAVLLVADSSDETTLGLIIWACYLILSVRLIRKGHKGAIWLFNSPAFEQKSSNVAFVPLFIASLTEIPREVREREFPDEPENVFKGQDDQPLPIRIVDGKQVEMVRPIRITTGGELPEEVYKALRQSGSVSTDAGPGEDLNFQMSVEQQVAVRYHINRSFDFFIHMKGRTIEEKIDYVEKQMADTIVSVLRREYAKRPIGAVLLQLQDIEDIVVGALEESTDNHGWGVEIDQVALKVPDITRPLNVALSSKPEQSAKAKAAEMEGRGMGRKKRREIEEIAAGEAAAAQSLGMNASDVRALDKITDALKPTDKVVLGLDGLLEPLTGKLFDRFKGKSAGAIEPPAN